MITVRRLIAQLKKLPPNAKVVFVDHDQDPDSGEFNGAVTRAEVAPDSIKDRGYGVMLL